MDKNMGKKPDTNLGKGAEKTTPKSAPNPNRGSTHKNSRQNSGTNDHGSNKRPRSAGHAKGSAAGTSPRRLADIRLVLESTPSDSQLAAKADAAQMELQAVERALAHEGTYLGIVDDEELEKRKYVLEKRCHLLKEEKRLLRTLRVQLAEEETAAATEQTESRAPSSPPPRHPANKQHRSGDDNTAALPPSPSLRISLPLTGSPSAGPPSAGSPPGPRRSVVYQLSPPEPAKGGGGGIGDFLKKNSAAVGKKLAAGGAGR